MNIYTHKAKERFACKFPFSINSQLHSKSPSARLLMICLTASFPTHRSLNYLLLCQWLGFYSEKQTWNLKASSLIHSPLLPGSSRETRLTQPISFWVLSNVKREELWFFIFSPCHISLVKAKLFDSCTLFFPPGSLTRCLYLTVLFNSKSDFKWNLNVIFFSQKIIPRSFTWS